MAKADLTAARLRELLHYDPTTGVFTWKVHRSGMAPKGSVAGSVYNTGYWMIGVDRRYYSAHRLAWMYMHGSIPEGLVIDHINGEKLDNRIVNLRVVSPGVNNQNRRRVHIDKTSSAPLGVCWDKTLKTWKASLRHNGRTVNIGNFKSPERAHEAYLSRKRALHEGCTI